MAEERLQKILAGGGLASRRAAERLITEGRVRLNGRIVTELGVKADPRKDRIEVDGKRVIQEPPVYYAVHKPRGFVTTLSDPEGRPSMRELLKPHGITARVFPIGRLDFHTSGLLLVTNDGEFSDGLLHPRHKVPKTYVVKVNGLMSPEDLDHWRNGVELDDGRTQPAEISLLRHEERRTWFEITIREGRNQQIRRMGEATGFAVMRLARIAFAGISLEGIAPGALRALTVEELVELKKQYGVPRSPGVGRVLASEAALHGESRNRSTRKPGGSKPGVSQGETKAPRRADGKPGAPRHGRAPIERGERGDAPSYGRPTRGEAPAPRGGAPRGPAPRGGAPRGGAPRGGAPRGDAPRGAPREEAPRGRRAQREQRPQRDETPRGARPTQGERSERGGAPHKGPPRGRSGR